VKDLIVLVADKNMKFGVAELLSRGAGLGLRELVFDIYVHPERDPSCLLRSHDFLRQYANRYRNAMVMFDREGCGQEDAPREDLETRVEGLLSVNGWGDRSAAIVFEPELESWVWSDSPHVDTALGWGKRKPSLRRWLVENGHADQMDAKPHRPKEAVQKALRLAHKPRSSSLYSQLAATVALDRCVDPAFAKFKSTLRNWFGR
jgi:hypothetical protein